MRQSPTQASSPPSPRPTRKPWPYHPPLTTTQLTALSHYKYSAEDRSITYRFLLAPLYTRLVHYLPIWLAPNTVTLLGFIFPFLTHLLVLFLSPTIQSPLPSWLHAFAAFSILFYMIMDNLDGKQARRTASSSPLGHLFDHGCDALNVTVSAAPLLAAVRVSSLPLSFALVHALGHVMFYGAVLEEFHTRRMVLRELNGPNEGLLTLATFQILAAVFGSQVFLRPVLNVWGGIHLTLNQMCSIVAIAPSLHAVAGNVMGIVRYRAAVASRGGEGEGDEGEGENVVVDDDRFSMVLARQFVPAFFMAGLQIGCAVLAPRIVRKVVVALLWQAGLVMFDAVTRIMLATVTRAEYPGDSPLFVPTVVVHLMVGVWGVLEVGGGGGVEDWDWVVVGVVVVWLMMAVLFCGWRTWCVVGQMCEFLNIRCFSLRPLRGGKGVEVMEDASRR